MRTKKDKIIFILVILVAAGLIFFGGYNLGYANVSDNVRLRVSTAETTASNCLNKISGWCDNKRFRLVDCGSDLQVCICMSQGEVQGLREKTGKKD